MDELHYTSANNRQLSFQYTKCENKIENNFLFNVLFLIKVKTGNLLNFYSLFIYPRLIKSVHTSNPRATFNPRHSLMKGIPLTL